MVSGAEFAFSTANRRVEKTLTRNWERRSICCEVARLGQQHQRSPQRYRDSRRIFSHKYRQHSCYDLYGQSHDRTQQMCNAGMVMHGYGKGRSRTNEDDLR